MLTRWPQCGLCHNSNDNIKPRSHMTSTLDSLLHIKAQPKYEVPMFLGMLIKWLLFCSRRLLPQKAADSNKKLPFCQHLKDHSGLFVFSGLQILLAHLTKKNHNRQLFVKLTLYDPPTIHPFLNRLAKFYLLSTHCQSLLPAQYLPNAHPITAQKS